MFQSVEVLSLPPPARHNSAIGHVGSLITTEDVRIEGVISHVKFHDSMIFMKNCENLFFLISILLINKYIYNVDSF